MGKPGSRSSRRSSSVKSNHSLILNNLKMPSKNSKEWRKKNNKNEEKIRKSITGLFNKLRESSTTLHNNSNTSIIVLDDTLECPNIKKRKQSSLLNETVKRRCLSNDSVVEIKDDDLVTNNNICSSIQTPKKTLCPIHSSTPNDKMSNDNKGAAIKRVHDDVVNLTKEINKDSYLTIDLTYNSDCTKADNTTVIDLEKTDNSFPLASVNNSTISNESDVTVVERSEFIKKNMQKLATNIGKMNSSEKGKLLELLTENIINGCNVNNDLMNKFKPQSVVNKSTETIEDTYIKEIIVGGASSHNSIGSNIYNPVKDAKNKVGLRMIVIDGSNVAMEHNKGREFSVKGLKICIDYFLKRGHVVKAFVPRFRCKFGKSSDPRLLDELERRGYVVYTPSREVQGKMITSYDDRYIVQCAAEFDAVIVSGDNYRDLMRENPRWKFIIENRLLQFTWVNDMIMFPRDPLGRNGPTLEEFLRHPPVRSLNSDLKRILEAVQKGFIKAEDIIQQLKEDVLSQDKDSETERTQSNEIGTSTFTNELAYSEVTNGYSFQLDKETWPSLPNAQNKQKTNLNLTQKSKKSKKFLKQKRLQKKQRRVFRKLDLKTQAERVNSPTTRFSSNTEVIDLDSDSQTPDFIPLHINKKQSFIFPRPMQTQFKKVKRKAQKS